MEYNRVLDISVQGLEAVRLQQEIAASNIANVNTTRSNNGGPYRRKVAILEAVPFEEELSAASARLQNNAKTGGVRVKEIIDDASAFQKVYNPGHPDADKDGYVEMPNVDPAREMLDSTFLNNVHAANVTAYRNSLQMTRNLTQIQ